MREEIMRYLVLRIQAAARLGRDASAQASIMKLYSAKQTKRVAELALGLEGPYGALAAPDAPAGGAWQRTFLFAPALRIAGGSDQVQRNVMGERVLRLPAEPRSTRTFPSATCRRTRAAPERLANGDAMDECNGRIALVTGASRGIGAAIAVRLARRRCVGRDHRAPSRCRRRRPDVSGVVGSRCSRRSPRSKPWAGMRIRSSPTSPIPTRGRRGARGPESHWDRSMCW